MKSLIFVLLIFYSFCQIYELKKFNSVKSNTTNGLAYLNTEDFSIGDTVHIQFNAVNGNVNSKIYYQFHYTIPNSTFYPSNSISPTNYGSTESNILGKITFTKKYYYDIKKKEDGKYLIISYSNFYSRYDNAYLKIEHTKVNWAITLIILFSIFSLFFIIIVIIIIYIQKYKNNSRNVVIYQASPSSTYNHSFFSSQYNQPNQAHSGYDSTAFNNYPQQQNIYDKPSQKNVYF